jgi:hypothetical protein
MKEVGIMKVEISKFHVHYKTNISLMKQQFAVTHKIPQNEISALPGILVTNTPSGKMARLKMLPINFH